MDASWALQQRFSLPYQRSLPQLAPFHRDRFHNWNINTRLLFRYLPALAIDAYQCDTTPKVIARRYAQRSENMIRNSVFRGFVMRQLDHAYDFLLHLVRTSANEGELSVRMKRVLEHNPQDDDDRTYDYTALLENTGNLFMAFAEISGQTGSRELAKILGIFFLRNDQILHDAADEDIVLLSHSISQSAMTGETKRACQRRVLRYFPDITDYLRDLRNSHASSLRRELLRIARDSPHFVNDLHGSSRNRGWQRGRLLPRRSWDDDDFDWSVGPVARYRDTMRPRSLSTYGRRHRGEMHIDRAERHAEALIRELGYLRDELSP